MTDSNISANRQPIFAFSKLGTALLVFVFGMFAFLGASTWAAILWSLGAILLVSVYNFALVSRDERGEKQPVLLPAVYLFGLYGVLFGVSKQGLLVSLLILGAIWFYAYEYYFPKRPPRFFADVFFLVALFLNLALVWAANFYFTLPWWLVLLWVFGIVFLHFRLAFNTMKEQDKATVYGLLSALLALEVAWAVLFWPVHFLTSALVNFAVLYLVFVFSDLYFRRKLEKNKIVFQVGIILVVVVLALLTSPWQP